MVGFNVRNKDLVDGSYLCNICTFLLREPMQLLCGHRYCNSCLNGHRSIIKCMQCDEETLKSKIFFDRGLKNDMQTLNIMCSLCHWTGIFKTYQNHLDKNHSNRCINQSYKNNTFYQIRQLVAQFKEYSNNVQILKAIMNRLLFLTSPYKISVEEQTPPTQFLQQIENGIVSCHGSLIWKIDNIKDRLNGAGSCITSSPFYTSPSGYKMCVRVYLNGNGQSTHVSIFLVLMRGDYDAMLSWPFDFQVIFCLYDLTEQKNHIIQSFQSDTKLKGFQRPKTEMNIGIGTPKFVPRSVLTQNKSSYVCNDTVYIKVMVVKDPISAHILPSIMNICPALPIHVEEEKIQEEIQRNKLPPYKLILTLQPS